MCKKSLEESKRIAQKVRKDYPDVIMIVMDKKGHKATYTASEWVYNERILDGWHTVVKYKNGEIVL